MKVINLFAGPGAGKSTTAAGLFHLMKIDGFKVELVTEYAKDLTWENNYKTLKNQIYIFANQQNKLWRLQDEGVEWVVTDSPLLLNLAYVPDDYFVNYRPLVREIFNSFDNYNFLIRRTKEYVNLGRFQSKEEALEIDQKVESLLCDLDGICTTIMGDHDAAKNIIDYINQDISLSALARLNNGDFS